MKPCLLLWFVAAATAAQPPLVETEWHVVSVSASQALRTPVVDEVPVIRFLRDGRYVGRAGCLDLAGTYVYGPGDQLSLTPAPSARTPASCRPSRTARKVQRVLGDTGRASWSNDVLVLRSPWTEVRLMTRGPSRPFVSQQMGRRFVYRCSGPSEPFEIVVQTGWDEAVVELPTDLDVRSGLTAVYARQVTAPTGARYETEGLAMYVDPVDVTLHLRGAGADLRSGGQTADCAEVPGASDGGPGRAPVVLRATGLTAGWSLSVSEQPDGARVYLNVGLTDVEAFDPSPERTAGRTLYRDEGQGVAVTVTDAPCVFRERGGPGGVSVRLRYDGEEWEGCGRTD